jgi:polygalacturonase
MRLCQFAGMLGAVVSLLASFACGGGNQGTPTRHGVVDSGSGDVASSSSGSGIGSSGASGSGGDGGSNGCGAGDPNLPTEPTIPPACATLQATHAIAAGALPDEGNLDTGQIQSALNGCLPGHSVQLTVNGANSAFITGPLTLPSDVTLWVDAGTTLYASRNPSLYGPTCGTATGTCTALIRSRGANSGVMGDGVIDGQGGEPMMGTTQSWWDLTAASNGGAGNPPLIQSQTATNFTLYRITLHNSPKFHVKLDAAGFVVWGITIKTPSNAVNSQGTALAATTALNTDGIDPGEAASNGYIVCSSISVGDDQIAIKGRTGVDHLTIAHNHFGTGHGMSIGSETNGGVSNINVYDLSIDGTNSGMGGGSSNGIRIKSDPSQGGVVTNVTYDDVCVREVANPIVLNPRYSTSTGTLIPTFSGIAIHNFYATSTSRTQTVTLRGYDSAHMTDVTLDNVVVGGTSRVTASFANVTLGPGNVSFTPSGTSVAVTNNVSGSTPPNPCAGKWVTF